MSPKIYCVIYSDTSFTNISKYNMYVRAALDCIFIVLRRYILMKNGPTCHCHRKQVMYTVDKTGQVRLCPSRQPTYRTIIAYDSNIIYPHTLFITRTSLCQLKWQYHDRLSPQLTRDINRSFTPTV